MKLTSELSLKILTVYSQALLLANSEPCFEWVARATAAVVRLPLCVIC